MYRKASKLKIINMFKFLFHTLMLFFNRKCLPVKFLEPCSYNERLRRLSSLVESVDSLSEIVVDCVGSVQQSRMLGLEV